MTPKQIQTRKAWILSGRQQKPHSYHYPEHLHRRAYMYGDIRCTNCKLWVDPDNPIEAKVIAYGKNGKRRHKNCPVRSSYVAAFVMFPKFHGTRKRRLETVKRY